MAVIESFKKELYSLPIEVVDDLKEYAAKTHQKKSHIVAEALTEYMKKRREEKLKQEALGLIGLISDNTPDIQQIKADRGD